MDRSFSEQKWLFLKKKTAEIVSDFFSVAYSCVVSLKMETFRVLCIKATYKTKW